MSNLFDLFKQIETPQANAGGKVEYLIVCLGNPGADYTFTRHNTGFLAADYAAQKFHFQINRLKYHALVGETALAGKRVLVMKPQTYMNNSGEAVGEAASFYKIPPDHVIVLCDDITLAPGRIRIRNKGSAGGHNGLKSIIEHLGSDGFLRVRIGVGERSDPRIDLADWVLGKIPESDKEALFEAIGNAISACERIIGGDLAGAMNLYNRAPETGKPAQTERNDP